MMIRTKAQHVAEAERALDAVRGQIDLLTDPAVAATARAESVAAIVAYAQAHIAVANTYPGPLEHHDLVRARARVAADG